MDEIETVELRKGTWDKLTQIIGQMPCGAFGGTPVNSFLTFCQDVMAARIVAPKSGTSQKEEE